MDGDDDDDGNDYDDGTTGTDTNKPVREDTFPPQIMLSQYCTNY